MGPTPKPSLLASAPPSWALPIAATILVAGSLVFWTCVGTLWLAARPAPQAPIVIYMPAGTGVPQAEGSPIVSQPPAVEDNRHVATR
jgi:hypothetical protein